MGDEKIPHMGWNIVQPKVNSPLFKDNKDFYRFYFTHSFHAAEVEDDCIIGSSFYGYRFTCAVQFKNIYGVQFHPEKSHKFGLDLMRNFLEIKC
jgi:glutamine amidotransferase